jgi:hypothetical protein
MMAIPDDREVSTVCNSSSCKSISGRPRPHAAPPFRTNFGEHAIPDFLIHTRSAVLRRRVRHLQALPLA